MGERAGAAVTEILYGTALALLVTLARWLGMTHGDGE